MLIHGIGSHLQIWSPVIDRLAEHHDVIAADSPGFGRSPALPPGVDPTVEAYATAFERFFGELGLRRPHVAGNSMGGGIALELGRRRAARSVTAISPVGFWTRRERLFCQRSLGLARGVPAPLQKPVLALAGSGAGRTLLMGQFFARPWRIPAADARLTLEDFWAAPAFSGGARRLRPLLVPRRARAPGAGHDRLGEPRPPAPLRAPGAARASRPSARAPRDPRRARAYALLRRPGPRGGGDAARDRGGPSCVGSRRASSRWSSWPCSRAWPALHRRRSRASAGARTWPHATEAARSAAGSWTGSGCPPIATGSTRGATRVHGGPSSRTLPIPPTPGLSSETTTWWRTPTTTATPSCGARIACTSG